MLIWTEEGKRKADGEGSLAWAAAQTDPGSGTPCSGPERLQTEVPWQPHCLAAGSVPCLCRAARWRRGRRPMAAAGLHHLRPCDLDPRVSIFSRIRAQSRLVARLGWRCGVGYMPTLPWQINRRCPSDSRCDSPFIQLTARTVNFWKTQLFSKPLAFCITLVLGWIVKLEGKHAYFISCGGGRAIQFLPVCTGLSHPRPTPTYTQHPLPTPLGCKLNTTLRQGGA